jgi:hypothetical protein
MRRHICQLILLKLLINRRPSYSRESAEENHSLHFSRLIGGMLLHMAFALLEVETEEVCDFVQGRHRGSFAEDISFDRLQV